MPHAELELFSSTSPDAFGLTPSLGTEIPLMVTSSGSLIVKDNRRRSPAVRRIARGGTGGLISPELDICGGSCWAKTEAGSLSGAFRSDGSTRFLK